MEKLEMSRKHIVSEIPPDLIELLESLYTKTWTEEHLNKGEYEYVRRIDQCEDLNKLVEISRKLLNENGFIALNSDWHSESHRYAVENSPIEPEFETHLDDFGAIHYKVNTIIYYLQKDSTIVGGNFIIYPNVISSDLLFGGFIELQQTKIITPVKTGTMILLKGNLAHRAEEMDGKGLRRSIVVQIRRK